MILLVHLLLKSACKLLNWIDEDLKSLAIHFKCLGQRRDLSFNKALRCKYHVALQLILVDINLTSSLIHLLQNTFTKLLLCCIL